jgi:hypothetical protein
MKQKWLMFVTRYNQKALKNYRSFLGLKPWRYGAKPILLLHATHLLQIRWVLKK